MPTGVLGRLGSMGSTGPGSVDMQRKVSRPDTKPPFGATRRQQGMRPGSPMKGPFDAQQAAVLPSPADRPNKRFGAKVSRTQRMMGSNV